VPPEIGGGGTDAITVCPKEGVTTDTGPPAELPVIGGELVGVPPVKGPPEELQAAKDPASATGSRPAPRTLRNHRRPYGPA